MTATATAMITTAITAMAATTTAVAATTAIAAITATEKMITQKAPSTVVPQGERIPPTHVKFSCG